MRCQHNLKQLALACHNYASSHEGRLPPGTCGTAPVPEQRFSFLMELLPYLEQDPLHRRLDRKQGWQAAANREVVCTLIKDCRCPADERTDSEFGNHTSYVGVAGD